MLIEVLGHTYLVEFNVFEVNAFNAGVEEAKQFAESFFEVFVVDGYEHSALFVWGVGEDYLECVEEPIFDSGEVFDVADVVAEVAADDFVQEELACRSGFGKEGEELSFFFLWVESQEVGEVVFL